MIEGLLIIHNLCPIPRTLDVALEEAEEAADEACGEKYHLRDNGTGVLCAVEEAKKVIHQSEYIGIYG